MPNGKIPDSIQDANPPRKVFRESDDKGRQTYATYERAEKRAQDGTGRYIIAATREGRFYPVFIFDSTQPSTFDNAHCGLHVVG